MLRLLVLGKTGQIATSIAKRTTDTVQIEAFGRDQCDITDPDAVSSVLTFKKPDIVINAAAYTAVDKAESEPDEAYLVNRDGAANIARTTAKLDIPLIHFSTDYVFSGDKKQAYVENDPVGPTGIYGLSKLAGEEAISKLNPKHIILRTAWVYSAYGNNFLKTMLRLAENRDELTIVADQFGNPSDAEDMAEAAITVAGYLSESTVFNGYGIYHICGPDYMNWADFARAIFRASKALGGPWANVRDITTAEYPTQATRPPNSSLDCSKFRQVFNYQNIPFEISVESTVKALLSSVNH